MAWVGAILSLIKALPELISLIKMLFKVNKEKQASDARDDAKQEWDDFEKKWKARKK
jgi:hypothetical protein